MKVKCTHCRFKYTIPQVDGKVVECTCPRCARKFTVEMQAQVPNSPIPTVKTIDDLPSSVPPPIPPVPPPVPPVGERRCVACGAAIAPGHRFCASCGAEQLRVRFCPSCGAPAEPDHRFCEKCGAPLTA